MSLPFIGSRISLISKSKIRFVGTLHSINQEESSISLENVQSFGTEGRVDPQSEIPPTQHMFPLIVFKGSDVMDLNVINAPTEFPPAGIPPVDQYFAQQQQQQDPYYAQQQQMYVQYWQPPPPQFQNQGYPPNMHPMHPGQPMPQNIPMQPLVHPGPPQMQGSPPNASFHPPSQQELPNQPKPHAQHVQHPQQVPQQVQQVHQQAQQVQQRSPQQRKQQHVL
jgi:protein LSM14